MKISCRLTTLVFLFSLTPGAGLYADNNHRQEVETMFRLTQMEDKVNDSVNSLMLMQLNQNPQLATHRDEIRAFYQRHIGWSAIKEDIVQMYLDNFSEQELKTINAFYITPTGQKVINVVPELVQQRNQLAMQRLQQNIAELRQIISQ